MKKDALWGPVKSQKAEAAGRYSGRQRLPLNFDRIKRNLQTNATCDINMSFHYGTIKNYNFSFDRQEITTRSADFLKDSTYIGQQELEGFFS